MMNPFALSFLIMLAFVLAELLILKWVRKTPVPWKDVIFNLNSGHILMWVFRGVEVARGRAMGVRFFCLGPVLLLDAPAAP